MNQPEQKPSVDPLDMNQEQFIALAMRVFQTERKNNKITKEEFINKYLVITEVYIKNRGYSPLTQEIRKHLENAVDNILGAEKIEGE